jgi:hypothetical protein
MRLRQIALVAEDLDLVRSQFYPLLGIDEAFVDEAVGLFGLQNIVMTIGDTFLEVVSPIREDTTAGRLLERRGGDGGYMVIVQVDDWEAEKARLSKTGIRQVWELNTAAAKSLHMHPRDVPGTLPSMDEMNPPQDWHYAGPGWRQRAARNVSAITAAQVQVNDPEAAAAQWSLAYGQPLLMREGMPVLPLGQTEIRFVAVADDRGEGLQGIDLRAAVPVRDILAQASALNLPILGNNTISVCGTRLRFA